MFRLRGAYFAIGTWVVAEVYMLSLVQVSALGSGTGMVGPLVFLTKLRISPEAGFNVVDRAANVILIGGIAMRVMLRAPQGVWA